MPDATDRPAPVLPGFAADRDYLPCHAMLTPCLMADIADAAVLLFG